MRPGGARLRRVIALRYTDDFEPMFDQTSEPQLSIFRVRDGGLVEKLPVYAVGVGGDWGVLGRFAFVAPSGPDGLDRVHVFAPPTGPTEQWSRSGSYVFDWYPDWSPTGRRIVFLRATALDDSARQLRFDLWLISGRRGAARRLTRAERTRPVFSPTGRTVAFSTRNGIASIFSRDSRVRRLLRLGRPVYEIAWQPLVP